MADGQTIAKAYIQILPSMENIKAELVKGLGDAPKSTGSDAGQTFGSSFGSTLKKALLGGAAMAAFKTLASKGVEAMKAAASVNAVSSAFDQTFAGNANTAAEAIGRVADSSGILDTRLTALGTKIYAFAKSSGGDSAESMDIMERALTAAADSAAYYDTSVEQATETLQSFLKGNYENDAALGLSATEATRNAAAYELFGQKFQDLTEIQKQETLLKMVEDSQALSGAVGQASREMDGWENVTGNCTAAWQQLMAQVGQPLLENTIPIIQSLTARLQEMASAVDWNAWGNTVASVFQAIINDAQAVGNAINWVVSVYDKLNSVYQDLTGGKGSIIVRTGNNLFSSLITGTNQDDVRNNTSWLAQQAKNGNTQAAEQLAAINAQNAKARGDKHAARVAQSQAALTAKKASDTITAPAVTTVTGNASAYTAAAAQAAAANTQVETTAEKAEKALAALGENYVYTGDAATANASRLAALQAAYSTANTNVDKYKALLDESVTSSGAASEMTQYLAQQLESAESTAESAKSALEAYNQELAGGTAAEQISASLAALGDNYAYTGDEAELAAQKLAYYEAQVASAQTQVDKLKTMFGQSAAETGYTSEKTAELASQLNTAESSLESAQNALSDYRDEMNTAKKAAASLKSAVSQTASVFSQFGGLVSDVGDALGSDFVSDMGSFISGIGSGINSVLSFITTVVSLIQTLQALSTSLSGLSAVGTAVSAAAGVTAASSGLAAAAGSGIATAAGTAAGAGILGTAAAAISSVPVVGWIVGGAALLGGGLFAWYKNKKKKKSQSAASAASSAGSSTSASAQRVTTINFGGVTIIVDGAKYDDPQKQAKQLAYELELLYKNKESVYA